MSVQEYSVDIANAAAKVSPPLTVTGVAAAGYSLQEWVLIATLVYTILQTAHLIWKFFKDRKADNGSE